MQGFRVESLGAQCAELSDRHSEENFGSWEICKQVFLAAMIYRAIQVQEAETQCLVVNLVPHRSLRSAVQWKDWEIVKDVFMRCVREEFHCTL
jgi:hypothetical protein